jgi:hypothetical protein
VYLTSFAHREELFNIAERWLCNRPEPSDGLRLTQILICDGFVLGETLGAFARLLLPTINDKPFLASRIFFTGDIVESICKHAGIQTPRVEELIRRYRANPDFFYVEAPINGTICTDEEGCLLAIYRIKRPRRIAEKANRYIANWIFRMVQSRAREMAEERARKFGIPLSRLLTPEEEMAREFTFAEEAIAQTFKEGAARLDKSALTINDVGGIKIVGDEDALLRVEESLKKHPAVNIVEEERHQGAYRARSMIVEASWDRETICRTYLEAQAWKRYLGRGVEEDELGKGIDRLLNNVEPRIRFELILSTLPDLVESELGMSIHGERIVAQRRRRIYRGYIPMNVEFLIEYLFCVGLSPQTRVDSLPVKLWGRYLPDTIGFHIRKLYGLPEYDALY